MIRKYNLNDFENVRRITQNYWGKEVPMSKALEDFIYDFLIRYYLTNINLTFVDDDNGVKAFVIASTLNDEKDFQDVWDVKIKELNSEDKEKANLYLDYLNYNHRKVLSYMDDNSVYLGLIASIKPRSGDALIKRLKDEMEKTNMKSLYLWTDETCNYKYYEKRNFKLIETYHVSLYGKDLKTFIYKLDL